MKIQWKKNWKRPAVVLAVLVLVGASVYLNWRYADNVAETDENFVTDRYALLLEQTILRQPDAWLWSHNRWRRKLNKK